MTNDTAKNEPIAPVYRYYVEDLISGKKLAELDFRGVSYKLALNAAGDFSGSLVVKDVANATNLYSATLPGVTALYVLRNNVCVWGGIIWEREYIPGDKKLSVSASEFTSYLHHRKIWKTWNHEFGATVAYIPETDQWKVVFDYGSNVQVRPGSTVKLEFFEVENFKHNGYFRVSSIPAPTEKEFYMLGGSAVADIVNVEYTTNTVYVYTKENHGFNTGDVISITYTQLGDSVLPENGLTIANQKITATGGPNSNMFSYTAASTPGRVVASGTAMRPLPKNTYQKVTVGVRQDTFDYVKSLIEGTFNDFVGTDFPNVYIEPGISTATDIVSKRAFGGYNIVKTAGKHNVAVGQAVQIQDVGAGFDGEFEVLGVEEGSSIVYKGGGDIAETPVTVKNANITQIEHLNGVATVVTSAPHNMLPGQNVVVYLGPRYPEMTGSFKVLDVPTPTKLRYTTGNSVSYPLTTISNATATSNSQTYVLTSANLTGNKATLTTETPHSIAVGDSVTVAGVQQTARVIEKSFDAPNGIATIQTETAHNLTVGTGVVITGLADVVRTKSLSATTTSSTFTTDVAHNLRVGSPVTISGRDELNIVKKKIDAATGIITTKDAHNFPVGAQVTVENLFDNYTVTSYRILNNEAILTTSVNHNVRANDQISVGNLSDVYAVSTKAAENGDVTLTTRLPHNVLENEKIKVSGLGAPFDGEVTVVSVTDQRVMYKVDSKYTDAAAAAAKKGAKPAVPITVPEQKAPVNAIITVPDSYVLGDWTVTSVTANTIRYTRGGNDYTSSGTKAGKLASVSPLNGVFTIAARTATTISYAMSGYVNSAEVAVPQAVKDDEIQAIVGGDSIYTGTHTISGVTPKTFTISKAINNASNRPVVLNASIPSVFNGTRTITSVPTADRFTFTLGGVSNSMIEAAQEKAAFAIAGNIYTGTYTVTDIDPVNNAFSYAKTYNNLPEQELQTTGEASVSPLLITSTFGPFPGNADIQFVFPDNEYSGVNIEPNLYRGFELKTVGEALDEYSNNIDGFEYRIDCEYLIDEDRFIKKFVIVPINFPNPPAEGEVSPISRFGADKLVFEYPAGSVSNFSIRESAEESATRFFALGENELGPDVGPYIGVASADELLRGERDGRRWPLLDASDAVDGIDDKAVLYAYAKRFLSEMQPPFASFQISVNGSRSPFIGTYKPGDWCSIVVDDPWMQMRLSSDLEPRDDVLVRKIDSISVSVPDGVTYPEAVTIDLVAEWEVDKRG